MSVGAIDAVWRRSQARHPALLVGLALADYADHDGGSFPSVARLADKCRLSERTVFRALDALEELGEVVREQRYGRSNYYRLTLLPLTESHPTLTDSQGGRVTESQGTPANGGRVPLPTVADITVSNRQEPRARARAREERAPTSALLGCIADLRTRLDGPKDGAPDDPPAADHDEADTEEVEPW